MIASATPRDYERSMRALLADPGIDSLLVIYIPPIASDPDAVARAIVRGTRGTSLPVVATYMSAKGVPRDLKRIPCYPFPESAAVALARVASYGEWRRRGRGAALAPPGIREEEARAIVAQAMSRGGGWLSPEEAVRLLDALGIPAARSRAVSDAREAVAAAGAIGYPVALKAVGPTILHKTEAGGLALSLTSAPEVAAAHADLSRRLGASMSGALVQEMVPGGVEVIVGATYDPAFGPLVLYGSGGTLVELLGDVSFRIAPLTGADVEDMLAEVRGTALLEGFRGAPAGDVAALRDALARVSVLLTLCPEVLELDINPLKVLPSGAKAVDARIRVGRPPAPPRSRRVTY
jgi:acyl-CoA synthetase (NDP forming)